MTFAAPAVPGDYEFRYMADNSLVDVARSETVTVSASATETMAAAVMRAGKARRR
jgi:post-segregation antitoxin (ccd killing protein)